MSLGIGIGYEYIRQQEPFYDNSGAVVLYPDQMHIVYPSIWGRFMIWHGLYGIANIEYDIINQRYYNYNYQTGNGEIVQYRTTTGIVSPMIGAGLKQPITPNLGVCFEAMYDITSNDIKSPYYNQPIIFRIGFYVGF